MALKEVLQTSRTDRQIFDQEPETVMLAGEPYQIKPTTKTRAKEFRAAAAKHRGFVAKAIELFRLASTDGEKVSAEEIFDSVYMAYTEKLDELYELVYIYCPNIEAEREKLDHRDTGATDPEWQIALWTVLKMTAGPFTRALGLSNGSGSGLLEKLSAAGVEYQKRQPTESKTDISKSIPATENEEKPSDTPGLPETGDGSPVKSETS
jgi:hypothetical protein